MRVLDTHMEEPPILNSKSAIIRCSVVRRIILSNSQPHLSDNAQRAVTGEECAGDIAHICNVVVVRDTAL